MRTRLPTCRSIRVCCLLQHDLTLPYFSICHRPVSRLNIIPYRYWNTYVLPCVARAVSWLASGPGALVSLRTGFRGSARKPLPHPPKTRNTPGITMNHSGGDPQSWHLCSEWRLLYWRPDWRRVVAGADRAQRDRVVLGRRRRHGRVCWSAPRRRAGPPRPRGDRRRATTLPGRALGGANTQLRSVQSATSSTPEDGRYPRRQCRHRRSQARQGQSLVPQLSNGEWLLSLPGADRQKAFSRCAWAATRCSAC